MAYLRQSSLVRCRDCHEMFSKYPIIKTTAKGYDVSASPVSVIIAGADGRLYYICKKCTDLADDAASKIAVAKLVAL
jgi:hypothetical protein